jgi:hypothetical protein
MKLIPAPVKPFPNYKWRWAVLTPTESLNEPPIFLGVLRVFYRYQNYAPSSKAVMDGLAVVQRETNAPVNLVRTQDRNLLRNSGQYWKALGLLEEAQGKIIVSPFGQLLSEGKITQVEFATTIVKTLTLPNEKIQNAAEIAYWNAAKLKIKPLELILEILSELAKVDPLNKFITPFELVKIIIPLAGNKATLREYTLALLQFRKGMLDVSTWPDCANNSNDKRMAREFLLFLSNYGFCQRVSTSGNNDHEKFFLSSISIDEITELHRMKLLKPQLENIVKQIRTTQIPANIERKRVSREILERPYQAVFRKNVLRSFSSKCLLTGVTIESVLQAAHIKPIEYKGSDNIDNGLCLRSDIHQLFDSNHLRILPSGKIILSEAAAAKTNYAKLPPEINVPDFVNLKFLDWRIKYY